jgi:hypothetical protein
MRISGVALAEFEAVCERSLILAMISCLGARNLSRRMGRSQAAANNDILRVCHW